MVFERTDDVIQPFRLETLAALGRLVRLGATVDTVLTQHAYPEPVSRLLGEAMALTAGVAGALKFDGVLSLQARGDGPLGMLVADYATGGQMRGYASYDALRLAARETDEAAPGEPVPRLLGAGVLAFTVDQGPDTERYQGLVELIGGTIADCAHHYFQRSEQFDAVVKLAAGRCPDGRWRAGALMLQREPDEGGLRPRAAGEDGDDDWRRALALAASATSQELLDPALAPDRLLWRLYHEDGVRVYRPRPLAFGCRCSRPRAEAVLLSLPTGELESLTIDGKIHVTCQFCNRTETFDRGELPAVHGHA
ncbi:MAG: Hsp33 family molecular chaperone HslO [Alphaproteobacteria bacterium]